MRTNLRSIPKLSDSISYIYIEHAIVERDDSSLMLLRKEGRVPIPVAATTCLLLGPGTNITHAAVKVAAESGCTIIWCGENLQNFCAMAAQETRSAENVLAQARLCLDDESRLSVARKMYQLRFGKIDVEGKSIQQLRGLEGIRVKQIYRVEALRTGVKWQGRNYDLTGQKETDLINEVLSYTNSILYSVCRAAIETLGFSTAFGFVHTGNYMSFVYDVADLYKADTSIPAAFDAIRLGGDAKKSARTQMRARLHKHEILKRIPADIAFCFGVTDKHIVAAKRDPWEELESDQNEGFIVL